MNRSDTVVPLHRPDPDLEEEARTAARLAEGIRKLDAKAETEMIERYSRGLGFLLQRRTGDAERAKDLLQETFCIAIEKLRTIQLENPERLAGYLRGIAVRVAQNAGRRKRREPVSIDTDAVAAIKDSGPRQYERISSEQTAISVRELLKTLAVPRDRELLMRFYVYDQDKDEICNALQLDRLHFNRVLYRAKKRFRKIVDGVPDLASPDPGNPA